MIPPNLNDLSQIELAQILRPLTKFNQRVIKLRFGLGGVKPHTLQETADILGTTREVIRKTEIQAMRQLGWIQLLPN